MKPWAFLILGLILVGLLVVQTRERFQPEMLDKRQVDRTVATQFSSYEQMTNHMPTGSWSAGPVEGIPTTFQVNQYKAYVPA